MDVMLGLVAILGFAAALRGYRWLKYDRHYRIPTPKTATVVHVIPVVDEGDLSITQWPRSGPVIIRDQYEYERHFGHR